MADRTIEAVAPIADLIEPAAFELIASGFTFSFDSAADASPEHQDVAFRLVAGERADLAALVWTAENDLGQTLFLRQPRWLLLASEAAIAVLDYASVTAGRARVAGGLVLAAGETFKSLSPSGNGYIVATDRADGDTTIRSFDLTADGAIENVATVGTY